MKFSTVVKAAVFFGASISNVHARIAEDGTNERKLEGLGVDSSTEINIEEMNVYATPVDIVEGGDARKVVMGGASNSDALPAFDSASMTMLTTASLNAAAQPQIYAATGGKAGKATSTWTANGGIGKSGKSSMMCSIDAFIGSSHNVAVSYLDGDGWQTQQLIVNVHTLTGDTSTSGGVVGLVVCDPGNTNTPLSGAAVQIGPARDDIISFGIAVDEGSTLGFPILGEFNCKTGQSSIGGVVPGAFGTGQGMISPTPLSCGFD